MEEANTFLTTWIIRFNHHFGKKTQASIFEKNPTKSEINLLLARAANRKVDRGHYIRYHNHYYLPTIGKEDKFFTRKLQALVIEAFDGGIYINIADKINTTRRLTEHEVYSREFDPIPAEQKERRKYIPPQSHPWKLASFQRYLTTIGKTLEEYHTEQTAYSDPDIFDSANVNNCFVFCCIHKWKLFINHKYVFKIIIFNNTNCIINLCD